MQHLKNLKSDPFAYAMAIMLAVFAALALSGCGTTPIAKTVQAEGVLIYSVDASMQAWADYVRQGKATQDEVDKVKAAYNYYAATQKVAHAAVDKWFLSQSPQDQDAVIRATLAVKEAKQAVIDLITKLMEKV